VSGWRKISRLKDEHLELIAWDGRLMLYNSCNGPYHCDRPAEHKYWNADDVRREGVWSHFLVLPEVKLPADANASD